MGDGRDGREGMEGLGAKVGAGRGIPSGTLLSAGPPGMGILGSPGKLPECRQGGGTSSQRVNKNSKPQPPFPCYLMPGKTAPSSVVTSVPPGMVQRLQTMPW